MSIVYKVFAQLSTYKIDGAAGLSWYCINNPDNTNPCTDGAYAYALPPNNGQSYVALCNKFFSSTWASAQCNVPGDPYEDASSMGNWQQPIDQPSTILHEMLHDGMITG